MQTGDPSETARLWPKIGQLRTRSAAGLVYGAIVCAATLAVAAPHQERGFMVLLAVFVTLVVYYLVHVFTEVEADRLERPDLTVAQVVRTAMYDEVAVLIGGLPAVAVFGLGLLLGAPPTRAVDFALWATVGLLGVFGWVVGRSAGAKGWAMVLEIAATALAGILMVVLKGLLH